MHISIIETSSLGDRSYLVSNHGSAVVIDPSGISTACCPSPKKAA